MKRLLIVSLMLVAGTVGFSQTEKPMYEIHAQMIYNFIKYIQWPNDTEPGEFVVGIVGEDDVFNTLKNYYDGKPKGAKKYSIRKLFGPEEPVLTITDSSNLGKKGSCINFIVLDGKLKFELNQASLTATTLKVASQLSSMAILL
jgi:hypothetical protein